MGAGNKTMADREPGPRVSHAGVWGARDKERKGENNA